MAQILGIDVGGTGTKGAIVDTEKGILLTERVKYGTPKPSYPEKMAEVVARIVEDLDYQGEYIGFGFPSVIQNGYVRTATNIDKRWIGVHLPSFFSEKLNRKCTALNDADAAAVAEVTYGTGVDRRGTLMMVTLGTGVGSGLYRNDVLIPNIEVGLLPWKGSILENHASNHARKTKDLSWKEWGTELSDALIQVCKNFNPDLIMLGGGVSKKFEQFEKFLHDVPVEIVPAALGNEAGVIGAAMWTELDQ